MGKVVWVFSIMETFVDFILIFVVSKFGFWVDLSLFRGSVFNRVLRF